MGLFSGVSGVRTIESRFMERAMGIEPTSEHGQVTENANLLPTVSVHFGPNMRLLFQLLPGARPRQRDRKSQV
jgi:hypothetical protein